MDVNTQRYAYVHPAKRISWSAIFTGALIAIGLAFLLHLFGMAIGLSMVNSTAEGARDLAIGGLISLIIGIIAAMLVAGYAAGYLGRLYCPQRNLGILYGFTTWTLSLLLSALLATHVTSYVAAYSDDVARASKTTATSNTAANSTGSATNDNNTSLQNTASSIQNSPTVKAATSRDNLVWMGFGIFALFFIGALASCAGACWGMTCARDD